MSAKPYRVVLSSGGNPDYGQDPDQPLSPTLDSSVANWAEASAVCRAYIKQYNLGAGNFNGGKIYQGGQVVARVSYNGRVWTPPPYPNSQLLYDPQ